ncbi:ABC transporter permease [Natronospirillum operosum]|uniref:ABC transporter permease n=1 Tax=Natronospirillum operosum TaxID=2759953 RepID=A0A4Z0WH41_9GAMM|nr:FtsX-like permease family protein [Natronospirillum operosum]TGG94088.1 ABC transporter permease [Natronospirillum operosum]
MQLTWQLAARNLTRNRRRTLLTGLIISLSTAALILTDAFILGFSDTAVRSATRMFPGDAQIHQVDYLAERDEELVIEAPQARLAQLDNEPEVVGYSPRVMAFGMISSAADNRATQVIGIDPAQERTVSRLADAMAAGDYLTSDGAETQLLMGRRLAELLAVELGDRIVISVHNQEWGGAEQALFRVSGLYDFNARVLDEETVFVLQAPLQTLLGVGDTVHEIALALRTPALASDPDLPLWQRLSDEQVKAQGWTTLMPQLAAMLDMTSASMALIGTMLFILAALGVTNGIFMSIYERTWEIGVLLAIGTRRLAVFRMILAETLLLALGAIAVGLALGGLATLTLGAVGIDYGSMELGGVAMAEQIRPRANWTQYSVYPPIVLALTLLAAMYPAAHAARIVPTRALHKSL